MKPEDFGIIEYKWVDGKLDVYQNVNLDSRGLTELPFEFGKVNGSFYCSHNLLTSLKDAPSKVGGNFSCDYNQLTSLVGAPSEVGGDFYCSCNQLTSLKGVPNKVNGHFYCSYNQLTSLIGAPNEVSGDIWCHKNPMSEIALIETLFDHFNEEKARYLAEKIDENYDSKIVGYYMEREL